LPQNIAKRPQEDALKEAREKTLKIICFSELMIDNFNVFKKAYFSLIKNR
jgi:hypothetical protein